MTIGRPKTPTSQLRLHGGLRPSDRHADREGEITPEGDATVFAELDEEGQKCWGFYFPRLAALGMATEVDSAQLTQMCIFWSEFIWWKSQPQVGLNAYKRLMAMATAAKQFNVLASKFGINPTDRIGLVGNMPTESDEFRSLVAKAQ